MVLVVVLRTQIDADHEELLRFKARIKALRVTEAAQEQPGSHQGDEGQRHLGYDQSLAESAAAPRHAAAAPAGVEHIHQVRAGNLPGRNHAEQDRRQHGDGECEREHAAIE